MKVQKIGAGAVLAGAVLAALVGGTGTAQAAPGVSVSVDGNKPVGIGDQGAETGATATSSKGNASLAIAVLGPVSADTSHSTGTGNLAVGVFGGQAVIAGPGDHNTATAFGGGAVAVGATRTNTVSVFGVSQTIPGTTDSTSVAVCGKALISAQGTIVSNAPGAPCKS